jgi:hypothetical protein
MLLTPLQGICHKFPHLSSILSLIHNIIVLLINQELGQPLDRIILLFPLFSFVLQAVQGGVIRSRVISNSISHQFDEIRFSLLYDVLTGSSGCLIYGQCIISIHSSTRDTQGDGSWDDTVRNVLILCGGRDSIFIVSQEK